MKIALVHRRYTTNGGTERYLVGFSRWLVAQGHDVHVLCHDIRPDLASEPGIRFHPLPMIRPTRIAKVLSLYHSVDRALQKIDFDRVLGFGRHPGHDLFRAGGGSHRAYLRRVHPYRRWIDPTDWVESWADRQAIRAAKIVVANSQLNATDLRQDYPGLRVEVVYNGVDLQRFSPDLNVRRALRAELGIDGPVALFLGTGFHRKGLDRAIAALPPGWKLWVVGEGRPLPGPSSVSYFGPQRDPERFLRGADVMLLPTRYDPFANSCLEAMACGLPVLTTPTNGASEVLPEPWMICDTRDQFHAALLRCTPELGQRCRSVAEGMSASHSFAGLFGLLQESR